MRLTRDEMLLVIAILTALLVGAVVQQHRSRQRLGTPISAPPLPTQR